MKFHTLSYIKRNFIFSASITSILFVGGYLYLTPYLSILQFKSALEDNNYKIANKYINYPSVRHSLKYQLKANLSKSFSKEIRSNSFAAFGIVLIDPLVDKLVEATVNPNGLKLLFNQGLLTEQGETSNQPTNNLLKGKNINLEKDSLKDTEPEIKLYYKDVNTFILSSLVSDIREPIKFIWARDGILHWRLNSLAIPYQILDID